MVTKCHYADLMLDALTIALCPELCQHNLSNPAYVTVGFLRKNSIMTPRLSGHFSVFGLVFLVPKSLLGIAR